MHSPYQEHEGPTSSGCQLFLKVLGFGCLLLFVLGVVGLIVAGRGFSAWVDSLPTPSPALAPTPAPTLSATAALSPTPTPPAGAPRRRMVMDMKLLPVKTLTFAREGEELTGSETYFVRLAELTVGGDFDEAYSEEVRVFLRAGSVTRLIGEASLDLPEDALLTESFKASAWFELAPDRLELNVKVEEQDATESETITSSLEPFRVPRSELLEVPQTHKIELAQIKYRRSVLSSMGRALLSPKSKSEFVIDGAFMVLELAKGQRTTSLSAEGKTSLAELEAILPTQALDPRRLSADHGRFQDFAAEALRRRGASRDTFLREVLVELALAAWAIQKSVYVARAGDGSDVSQDVGSLQVLLERPPASVAVLAKQIEGDLRGLAQGYAFDLAQLESLAKLCEAWAQDPALRQVPEPGDSEPGDSKPGDSKTGDSKTGDPKTAPAPAPSASAEPAPPDPRRELRARILSLRDACRAAKAGRAKFPEIDLAVAKLKSRLKEARRGDEER